MVNEPAPVAQGFGSPIMIITQGYGSQSGPPPPGPMQIGAVIVVYIPTMQ